MNRLSASKGEYNLFSQKIKIKDFSDIPVFAHEFCHHIHNATTALAAERFNLVVQILAHISNLSGYADLRVPFNEWWELEKNKNQESKLFKRLNQIYQHQVMWDYLEKSKDIYPTKNINEFTEKEVLTEFFAVKDEPEYDSKIPYILVHKKEGEILCFPIGGFAITESAAFALELFYRKETDINIISEYINAGHFEYVIVLYYVLQYIHNFQTACLFTFLVCDLALSVSMPSVGFLIVALYIDKTVKHDFTMENCFEWYEFMYNECFKDDIEHSYRIELEALFGIKSKLNELNITDEIRLMFDYQVELLEKGLSKIDVERRLEVIKLLLTITNRESIDNLLKEYPMTVIETNDENMYFMNEKYVTVYEFLQAVNDLYWGLCKDFKAIINNENIIKHFTRIDTNKYRVDIQKEEGSTDACGVLLHTFGLNDKTITFKTKIRDIE